MAAAQETGDDTIVEWIHHFDQESGEFVRCTPSPGAECQLWSGACYSRYDRVALLACVALNGFHGVSSYQWFRDGRALDQERYPVLYAVLPGVYTCEVTPRGKRRFIISSEGARELPREEPMHSEGTNVVPEQSRDEGSVLDGRMQHFESSDFDGQNTTIRLVSIVGKGSSGTVHRAIWRGSVVAAKVLPLTESRAILREVEACSKLHHPNIVSFMGSVLVEQALILVMNYVEGPNLHNLLFDQQYSRVRMNTKRGIAIEVAQALMFLHTASPPIAHLDVKPGNVLVELKGYRAYLSDFGLARAITSNPTMGSATILAGSPGFQPPEQLQSQQVGTYCDVYAFGGLITVLFGERPLWENLTPYQIIYKVSVESAKPVTSHLPQSIGSLAEQCLGPISSRPSMGQIIRAMIGM